MLNSVGNLLIEGHFDADTSTVSYLLVDRATMRGAIIDSVLDFDIRSGRTSTRSADALIARVGAIGAKIDWLIETHVHADHLSAAPYLKKQLGGRIAIGAGVLTVQQTFGALFNAGAEFIADGTQFDVLVHDDARLPFGELELRAMHTPGHTPACMSYVTGDATGMAAFVGDTLFMPDYGSARCDFPGGDARTLYRSIRKVLALPGHTKLYSCHDYPPNGRPVRFVSTVDEQRAHNLHIRDGIDEDAFVAMRTARDATLAMPALMLPSVQINMRGGHFPPPESNGLAYLKIPLNGI
ncbi:MAG TPA: MBL fold metallo-hydrolase [Paraburkholderia sp.]